jgi:NADPH:quinone reductase-like Zn-dependent oxidoreductase
MIRGAEGAGVIESEAWVIHAAEPGERGPAVLRRESVTIDPIRADEVLVEPLYGSWEANMTHALERRPIDICRRRGEPRVVLGNSGVVRIAQAGRDVQHVREGDTCLLAAAGQQDRHGYVISVLGYDARGSMGLLSRTLKLRGDQVVRLPAPTRHRLTQWAAFSVRFGTAWDNWRVAHGVWQLQVNVRPDETYVWGWGGGVAFAELLLAKRHGCRTAMIASTDDRLATIAAAGLTPIDRRLFADLSYDAERCAIDSDYRRSYLAAERAFLDIVSEHTSGERVSIFIDNIGGPVVRATLHALGRQGVLTTAGWKHGTDVHVNRAAECIARHVLVHTHASRNTPDAMNEAEETGWLPPVPERVYAWDDIPQLAADYSSGRLGTYFPVFQVNRE